MKIKVLTGVPGGGKSRAVHNEILSTPALYLLALPRTDLIDEFVLDLERSAEERGMPLIVAPIHSKQAVKGRNVHRRVLDALACKEIEDHRVILVTHETLLTLNPTHLVGVHVRIDENPDGSVLSGEFHGKTGSHLLDHHFILEPLEDGSPCSLLRPRSGVEPVTPAAYKGAAPDITILLKAASNQNRSVLVNVNSWDQARITGRRVRWWSIWTPMELDSAASVQIAAAGFRGGLLARACGKLYGDNLAIEYVNVANRALRANPAIRVHYFTEHRGSTTWWTSDEGSLNLVRISEHLTKIGFAGYWSCNHEVRLLLIHRFGGDACAPRQAGTNSLRHHKSCAFIYSNKAQAADSAILDFLDLDSNTITHVRENEDIAQFVMRGAIRNPSYDGTYDIYLYDRHQAEALRDYLIENVVSDLVELIPVDEAGLMDMKRPLPFGRGEGGWQTSALTPEERRQRDLEADRLRKRKTREADREQLVAAGTPPKRGRPPKNRAASLGVAAYSA
jgi:hypothetical protein